MTTTIYGFKFNQNEFNESLLRLETKLNMSVERNLDYNIFVGIKIINNLTLENLYSMFMYRIKNIPEQYKILFTNKVPMFYKI